MAAAARAVGLHHAARHANRRRLLVCCYHGVRNDDDPLDHWLLVPLSRLVAQLRYLAAHYHCVPIDIGLTELAAGRLREPTACITFDDGYRNNLSLALPLLRELGLPATVYLPTGLIGTNERLWTTRLELAVRATAATTLDLRALGCGVLSLDSDAARRHAGAQATSVLKRYNPHRREGLLRQIHDSIGVWELSDGGAFATMTWDEVREMEGSGLVTLGAHTVHHAILSRLDDSAVRFEVEESVRAVAREVANPSRTFAYPNGTTDDFDDRARAAVQRAGLAGALSTIDGINGRGADPYALRRVSIGADMSQADFELRTSGAVGWLKRVAA